MDSRIREIEHRLARAKAGLVEGGREDYLKQLFLLDAEIRTTIRENGVLPEHLKELLQDTAPPRKTFVTFNPTIAFATMLLVATVTYGVSWFSQPGVQIAFPRLSWPAAAVDSVVTPKQDNPAEVAQPVPETGNPVILAELELPPAGQPVADPIPELPTSDSQPAMTQVAQEITNRATRPEAPGSLHRRHRSLQHRPRLMQ